MGIVSKTEAAARQLESKPSTKTQVSLTEETDEFIKRFPIELRGKVLKKAVGAATKIVQKDVKARLQAHRSRNTGTRKKWSQKVREQRARHDQDLYQSIGTKTVEYNNVKGGVVVSMVGARWPQGAHFHLLEFGGYRHVLWGDQEGQRVAAQPTLRPAVQSTEAKQRAAIIGTVKKEWKNV